MMILSCPGNEDPYFTELMMIILLIILMEDAINDIDINARLLTALKGFSKCHFL